MLRPVPTLLLTALVAAATAGCGSSAPASTTSRAAAEAALAEARRASERVGRASDGGGAARDLAAAEAALAAGDLDGAAHRAYLARQRARIAALQAEVDDAEREVTAVDAEGGRRLLITDAFRTARTELRPDTRDAVERVAEYLVAHPDRVVLVEGFTDSTGNEDRNLDLSRRRADAVKAQLVGAGVDADRIVTAGYGQLYPVASNETAEGQRENRRIEITVATRLDALTTRDAAGL